MDFFGILFDMKNGKKIPYSKNYFDTLFAENLAGVTTLTGTLPLTFTTSETKLRSWTIYGADIEHIETASGKSITFYTDEDKLRDWKIYGNDNIGKNKLEITAETQTLRGVTFTIDKQAGTVTMNGDTTQQTAGFSFEVMSSYDLDGTFILSGGADGGSASKYDLYMYDAYDQRFSDRLYNSSAECSFTCVSGHRTTVFVQARKDNIYSNIVFRPMLRLADTSAEFEPYQIGVGQRTNNGYIVPLSVNGNAVNIPIGNAPLTAGQSISKTSTGVDIATADGNNTITTALYNQPEISITYRDYLGAGERTKNLFNKTACELVQIDTEGTMKFGTQLDVKGGAQYTLINTNPRNVDIYILVHSESLNRYQSTQIRTSPVRFIMPSGYKAYLRTDDDVLTDWDTIGVTDIALYEGNLTNPSFVPYGYKIPLTITSGQQSTDYDIFIGDAPLTEGQSVTDTLTISTFEGANTIDTTLENKPQMSITYKGG